MDLSSWLSGLATLAILAGVALVRRHWGRLPSLEGDPGLPAAPPSVCLCIPVRNEARELPAALDS